ncbi:hypothetical protein ACFWPU_00895 [Streptomyces sp. NPDC058471]|uniref:hypothetical protein n=1 Tax=Streptomyces sp. NPDC058471 TaxID=3346516 RepID=UPI0036551C5C
MTDANSATLTITDFQGDIITVLVDGRRIFGELRHVFVDDDGDATIMVGPWRINAAEVHAWAPGNAEASAR